jgi:GNAT superfamily N-acetyltransferase
VAELAATTGGPLDEYMHGAIDRGTASTAVLEALASGNEALLDPAARFASNGDPTPMAELSTAMVAEVDSQVVGALYALAPGSFIWHCTEQGMPLAHAAVVSTAAVKIKALAVEPDWRGGGIASALLSACTDVYDRLGYFMQYGSFDANSGLGAFYRARGFDLVPHNEGIDMYVFTGVKSWIGADGNEQLFVRWRR